jgi:chromosomal replication initiation ATPase DnaA
MSLNGESLLTGGHILGDVAKEYWVPVAHITGRCRAAHLVEARQECARRLYHEGLTVTDIGRVLKRHHSTVIHYLRWDDVVGRKG